MNDDSFVLRGSFFMAMTGAVWCFVLLMGVDLIEPHFLAKPRPPDCMISWSLFCIILLVLMFLGGTISGIATYLIFRLTLFALRFHVLLDDIYGILITRSLIGSSLGLLVGACCGLVAALVHLKPGFKPPFSYSSMDQITGNLGIGACIGYFLGLLVATFATIHGNRENETRYATGGPPRPETTKF